LDKIQKGKEKESFSLCREFHVRNESHEKSNILQIKLQKNTPIKLSITEHGNNSQLALDKSKATQCPIKI